MLTWVLQKLMTLEELIANERERLRDNGYIHAEREIDLLLGHLYQTDTAYLIAHYEEEVPTSIEEELISLVDRRLQGEPLAYLIGTQNFMGYLLKVDSRALIPRPETEQLVEHVIRLLAKGRVKPERILEIGTGSGAMALILKKQFPHASVVATDISDEALSLAEENASRLKLAVDFVQSDLFEKVEGKYDLIVANLPYVPTERLAFVSEQILDHEPIIAIEAKEDGLQYIQPFLEQVGKYLNENGVLAIEMWHTHGDQVRNLVEKNLHDKQVETVKDLANFDRFALIS